MIINFTLADIEISANVLILKKLKNLMQINLSDLKINNITIRRHPLFFLETSTGNYNINYTNQNYQYILELLKKTNFIGIESFELKVKQYIINIKKR